jgi:hypothetical protein
MRWTGGVTTTTRRRPHAVARESNVHRVVRANSDDEDDSARVARAETRATDDDDDDDDARGIALDAVRDARGEEGKLAEQGVRGVRQTVHVEEKVGKLLGRSDDVLEVVQR